MPAPTVAQEAITNAILASLIACAAVSVAVAEQLGVSSISSLFVFAMFTFVVSGYIVPNIVALWLGRPLQTIMTDDPTHP